MALVMYHESGCTTPVDGSNPDEIRQAVSQGSDLEDVKEFWVKSDDDNLTYENISVTASGDDNDTTTSGEIDVTYSTDGTNYSQSINLSDSDFGTAVKIWRKVFSPNVQNAFNNTSISHQITADEYVV